MIALCFYFMISCVNHNNYLIIPNKGVGRYIISKQVNKKNVLPDELHLQYERGVYLRSIVIYSDKYYTKEGIRVGMNLDELVKKCGQPTLIKKIDVTSGEYIISPLGEVYIYNGIAYLYNEHRIIIAIYIFKEI